MAGAFITLVLDAVREIPPNALLTLLALADRANKAQGGRAWPSLRDIATRTNRQERQVRADLRVLEADGWIDRLGPGRGGRGRATTYQLNLPAMLLAMPREKAALHVRELRKIPGTLPPGFALVKAPTMQPASNGAQLQAIANPAFPSTKPGSGEHKPGSPAQETRHSTAPEPELNRNYEPELEPERARATPQHIGMVLETLTPFLKNRKAEPEKPAHTETDPQPPKDLEAERQRQLAEVKRLTAST